MGSSGGSGSGAISFPAYVQTIHGRLLDDEGTDQPDTSVMAAINTAAAANPFVGVLAYDPGTELTEITTSLGTYLTVVSGLVNTTDYTTAYNTALGLIALDSATLDVITLNDTEINADIAAYENLVTQQLETGALPQFRAGMLNIGAVNGSAFVIGEALLRAFSARDVSKYATDVRSGLLAKQEELNAQLTIKYRELEAQHKIRRGELVRQATVQMLAELLKQAELYGSHVSYTIDNARTTTIARQEENSAQADYNEKETLWELELYQYIGNMLAAPGGGTASTQKKGSKAQSALGGTLSGAAVGASVGGVYGAAIGAVIGLGLSFA